MPPADTGTSLQPETSREIPQAWMSALARAKVRCLTGPAHLPGARARFSWLEKFARDHGASLQEARWSFEDVFEDVLNERCIYFWRGDYLGLKTAFSDRLQLHLDDKLYTIYRGPVVEALTSRPVRRNEPPRLAIDHSAFLRGPGARNLRLVLVALICLSRFDLPQIVHATGLTKQQVARAVEELEQKQIINSHRSITPEGWRQIALDLPDYAELAESQLRADDSHLL